MAADYQTPGYREDSITTTQTNAAYMTELERAKSLDKQLKEAIKNSGILVMTLDKIVYHYSKKATDMQNEINPIIDKYNSTKPTDPDIEVDNFIRFTDELEKI